MIRQKRVINHSGVIKGRPW